jgi:hypothetical protein
VEGVIGGNAAKTSDWRFTDLDYGRLVFQKRARHDARLRGPSAKAVADNKNLKRGSVHWFGVWRYAATGNNGIYRLIQRLE